MKLYGRLTREKLNSIVYVMLHNFHRKILLDLNQLDNEYCILNFNLNGNQEAGDEYIITSSFLVNLTDAVYNNVDYYLRLYYYDLQDGDITNTHDYDTVKTKTVKLTAGDNTISFDEDLVYLQRQCDLIVKGG